MARKESAVEGRSGESLQVGGKIRRVAIVTTELNPCACYLARRLRSSGVEILLVNQTRPKIKRDSLAYFRRLLSRRGFLVTFDYFLFSLVNRSLGAAAALRSRPGWPAAGGETRPGAAVGGTETPALRPDPDLVHEPWLTLVEVENINRKPERERLRTLRPDLMLLAGAPILSSRTIAIASVACINPHSGISPDFAGSSAPYWAIYEGRFHDIGYTVHLVVPKVDSGPILFQEKMDWDPRRPLRYAAPAVAQRMYDKLTEMSLAMIRGEKFRATPQKQRQHVRPPAGLYVRLRAEIRRKRYAARQARSRRGDTGSS